MVQIQDSSSLLLRSFRRIFSVRGPHRAILLFHRHFSSVNDHGEGEELPGEMVHNNGGFRVTRRPEMAELIRQGLGHLNESASYIQKSDKTRKQIQFEDNSSAPTERQQSESHRLLSVTSDCLDELSRKNSIFSIQGEPIVLLDISVKPSIKVATIYWTLPYSILLNDSLSHTQKVFIQARMEGAIEEQGGEALLQRKVTSALRDYFPPKIRLESASQEMISQHLAEFDEIE